MLIILFLDGDSAALLAMLIFDGLGTKISQTESELWSKVANEFGTPFGKGIYLYLQKNFKEAINYLLPFSEDVCFSFCFWRKMVEVGQ